MIWFVIWRFKQFDLLNPTKRFRPGDRVPRKPLPAAKWAKKGMFQYYITLFLRISDILVTLLLE